MQQPPRRVFLRRGQNRSRSQNRHNAGPRLAQAVRDLIACSGRLCAGAIMAAKAASEAQSAVSFLMGRCNDLARQEADTHANRHILRG